MKIILSVINDSVSIGEKFHKLRTYNNRSLYIAKSLFTSLLNSLNHEGNEELALKEIGNKDIDLDNVLAVWLGLSSKCIVDVGAEEADLLESLLEPENAISILENLVNLPDANHGNIASRVLVWFLPEILESCRN